MNAGDCIGSYCIYGGYQLLDRMNKIQDSDICFLVDEINDHEAMKSQANCIELQGDTTNPLEQEKNRLV